MARVLHITDCYDGGVYDSINSLVALVPEVEHEILYSGKSNPPIGLFVQETKFASDRAIGRWFQIFRLLKLGRADVVHLHSSRAGALARTVPISKTFIFQPHGISYEQEFSWPLRVLFLFIEWSLGLRTSFFIAVSETEKVQISRIASKSKIFTVPNSSAFNPAVPNHSIPIKKKCATIGLVVPGKDPWLFAQIAQQVSRKDPSVEFVWIGAGDEILESGLREAGIRVTGWLDKQAMAQILSQTSIYLHPSRFEGFPIAVLDAAAFEIPIIVKDIKAFSNTSFLKFKESGEAAELVIKLLADPHYYLEQKSVSTELKNRTRPSARKQSYVQVLRLAGVSVE